MATSSRDEIVAVFDALDAGLDRLCGLSFEVLTTPERLRALERLERVARRLRVPQHPLINQLAAQADKTELGGTLCEALATRLGITKPCAARRIAEAADLGPRRALTGQPLEPVLSATAAGQHAGRIGDGQVKVIRDFFKHLPAAVDALTREAAEADLADKAAWQRPDELAGYAQQMMNCLHPDGDFTDEERTRSRGITLGAQQRDGMSTISGLITPELRAAIEALWAKLAAPGMANPADDAPVIDGEPDPEVAGADRRSTCQRQHDATLAALRALFASGDLGTHRGLPVTIIVTTTLHDLEAGTGTGRTSGATLLPITDVIRMASHAHHYLALFDRAKPLALYHTQRLANPAQRIMLHAKDRGCTKPGCNAPAYHSEVHHITGWTKTQRTDITDLTLACGIHNRLAEHGWTTRTNTHGHTEWLPPPHQDHGQPRTNTYHHPEKLLNPEHDDEPA